MSEAPGAIAVVGLACVFPGAPDLQTFWSNITGAVDAISDVPAARFDPVFFETANGGSNRPSIDRFYCHRGGFIDDRPAFDATRFGIMPLAVEGAEPDQLIALTTAAAAIDDAGGLLDDVARERVGVILGRGGYLNAGVARLDQKIRTAQQLVNCLRTLVPDLDEGRLSKVKEEFQRQLGPDRPEASIGLVPNLAASRIANRLDLFGPAYTVDAACASSLVAIDNAVRELQTGRCDAMIAGGVHHCHDVTLWSVFSQLRALSPTGAIRPFSRHADGILIGEGTGMVVLERLADAERLGHRIYAVIRGSGVASDGRDASLMSPRPKGQVLSLERAYGDAGIDPGTIGLVEAHGTATRAGDRAELETLRQVFGGHDGRARRAGLGSVKSMIGHAMPAAGAAGFIKAVLAVHHAVLPPTLHGDDPAEGLEDTRFRLISECEDWPEDGQVRRAGINAFGFGGINAHVVIEHHGQAPSRAPRRKPASSQAAEMVILLEGVDAGDLRRQLATAMAGEPHSGSSIYKAGEFITSAQAGPGLARLAIVDPTPRRLDIAMKVLDRDRPWRGRNDIWFEHQGLIAQGGRVAFVFPGVEPVFDPRVDDVAEHFGMALPPVPEAAGPLEVQGRGIVAVGRLLHAVLGELGVRADDICGHSIGEWTGMMTAELIPPEEVDPFIDSLEPGRLEVPGVVYAAAGCGVQEVAAVISDLPDVTISHDNCPHQAVICGAPAAVAIALKRLAARNVLAQELPFRSGFHSPMFVPYVGPIRAHWTRLPLQPARVPLWSATTCAPYPDDPEGVRSLSAEHLVRPVRFRELVEAMYGAGARVFVQMGVGSLTGFINDTLGDRDNLTVTANGSKHSGMGHLRRVAAALWAAGADVAYDRLLTQASPGHASASASASGPASAPTPPSAAAAAAPDPAPENTTGAATGAAGAGTGTGTVALMLGTPLVRLPASMSAALTAGVKSADLVAGTRGSDLRPAVPAGFVTAFDNAGLGISSAERGASPLAAAHLAVLEEVRSSAGEVLAALAERPKGPPRPNATKELVPVRWNEPVPALPEQPETVRLSVNEQPWLADHCFYRQREGWAALVDRFPVLPMTTMVELMADLVRRRHPDRVVTAIDGIRALRWLMTDAPTEISVGAVPDGANREKCSIDRYALATVTVADNFPPPPPPALPATFAGERPPAIDAAALYDEHWMFHGPQFQGVRRLEAIADDGIRATIESLPAPGSLLDNAGQVYGYWVMATAEVNFLALPLSVDRIEFFGPLPPAGAHLQTIVQIRSLDARSVRADLELVYSGDVVVRITGWEDRRFDSDPDLWTMLRYPETELLATVRPGGYVAVDERWLDSASRELIMRRYLNEAERRVYEAQNPLAQRRSLLRHIAVKDAVRHLLWSQGHGPLFPAELTVVMDDDGRGTVTGPFAEDVRICAASTGRVGVARARHGIDVGIAIAPASEEAGLGDRWTATEPLTCPVYRLPVGASAPPDQKEYVVAWT